MCLIVLECGAKLLMYFISAALSMQPLFLGSYGDGSMRIEMPVPTQGPGNRGRPRRHRVVCKWPHSTQEGDGVPHASPELHLFALVSSRDCLHNSGPLTSGCQATKDQLEFYRNPSDWYEICLEKIRVLQTPEIMDLKLCAKPDYGGMTKISISHPLFFPFSTGAKLDEAHLDQTVER